MKNTTAFVVFGLGYGDEGKGSITDFLVRYHGVKTVVRYNGGPQAGHNVVTPDGRLHCFAHFGSGTFVDGTETFLSHHMLVEPENLESEEKYLRYKWVEDAYQRLTIDADCSLITPAHKMICQMREITRGKQAHGSCGMGVGQAIFDKEDGLDFCPRTVLFHPKWAEEILVELCATKLEEAKGILKASPNKEAAELYGYYEKRCDAKVLIQTYRSILMSPGITIDPHRMYLAAALEEGSPIVFEGAQGALLDRKGGFTPYVTKSKATWHNAGELLYESANKHANPEIVKIGVARAYMHRHGSGPFVTEEPFLNIGWLDYNNLENRWQGEFRTGWFDLLATRYGLLLNGGADMIALTNLDRLTGMKTVKVCTSYLYEGDLDKLDKYFEWEKMRDSVAKILGFKALGTEVRSEGVLAEILSVCKPFGWIDFPGWKEDICRVRSFEELPSQARELVDFLQGREGLGTPIGIISVNQLASGKFFI